MAWWKDRPEAMTDYEVTRYSSDGGTTGQKTGLAEVTKPGMMEGQARSQDWL